ncbi:MAG: hypothetical protein IPK50_03205 [Fibrobacterota bacterium]|nr:hypothetical protein [Fibrobacterota bacterium]QQS05904.1 MAG: hypothetical protein IPK50_03205 [Fibrobacterota bacterium]
MVRIKFDSKTANSGSGEVMADTAPTKETQEKLSFLTRWKEIVSVTA